jgi:hypothetical protein
LKPESARLRAWHIAFVKALGYRYSCRMNDADDNLMRDARHGLAR